MMRRLTLLCCTAVALVGCAQPEDQATTDTAGTAAAIAAPATISLADVAGKWNVRAVPESGTDTTATTYVLTATADTTGWTITFPNRQPVPLRVTVAGDSITYSSAQFESVRRRGVQVTTEGVGRIRDGRFVGAAVAHYKTTRPDSVLRLRVEGTRAP